MTQAIGGTAMSRPGTWWGWAFFAGIALILVGILAVLQPVATSLATGVLLGSGLILCGLLALAAGLANPRAKGAWLYVALGLLGLVAGMVTILDPFAGTLSLVRALAAWLVAGGILLLVAAFGTAAGRVALILLGLLDIAFGILLFVMDPISAMFFVAILIGVSLVYRGVASVVFALRLRRLSMI